MTDFIPEQAKLVASTMDGALDLMTSGGVSAPVFLLALHGGDGENGWIQQRLEVRKLFFTGSSSLASAHAMDKVRSKATVAPRGILVAKQMTLNASNLNSHQTLMEFQKSLGDIVIKPVSEGSSAGLSFISTAAECATWLSEHKTSQTSWLVEERLVGREFTIGVMSYKGCLMVLPPSEVILERNAHFDFQGKYLGVGNKEITPADLSARKTAEAQAVALMAHTAIGCFGYTRSEMILTERGFYFLETNTLPGFTRASFIPQQLRAADISVESFIAASIFG